MLPGPIKTSATPDASILSCQQIRTMILNDELLSKMKHFPSIVSEDAGQSPYSKQAQDSTTIGLILGFVVQSSDVTCKWEWVVSSNQKTNVNFFFKKEEKQRKKKKERKKERKIKENKCLMKDLMQIFRWKNIHHHQKEHKKFLLKQK